jgi:hypothetical protein
MLAALPLLYLLLVPPVLRMAKIKTHPMDVEYRPPEAGLGSHPRSGRQGTGEKDPRQANHPPWISHTQSINNQ